MVAPIAPATQVNFTLLWSLHFRYGAATVIVKSEGAPETRVKLDEAQVGPENPPPFGRDKAR